jgi:myosin heavy subunit
MLGATISQFLLEKARVVKPPPGELNYSIFYTLVEGCDTPYRRALGLNAGVHNYKLLCSGGGEAAVDPVLEVSHFRAIVASFSALGLQSEMQFVFEILAAILHLGNIFEAFFCCFLFFFLLFLSSPPPPSFFFAFPCFVMIAIICRV